MTTPNDRQRQAEEMANKYCDENFATQHHDEYWENKSSYLKGWTDADSTPPQQEGDEEFYKRINYFVWNYCDRDQRMTAESAFVQVLSDALAHARRTHAAEIERLKKAVDLLKTEVDYHRRAWLWFEKGCHTVLKDKSVMRLAPLDETTSRAKEHRAHARQALTAYAALTHQEPENKEWG